MANGYLAPGSDATDEVGVLRGVEEQGVGDAERRGTRGIVPQNEGGGEGISLDDDGRYVFEIGGEDQDTQCDGEKLQKCDMEDGPRGGIEELPMHTMHISRERRGEGAIFGRVGREEVGSAFDWRPARAG